MRIVKQNRFKNLGELHKEWTEAGVKASRATTTYVSRNLATVVVFLLLSHSWTTGNVRGVLPGLRKRELDCCPVVQSPLSDESKFCISFGNQGPRVWRKGGEAHSPSLHEVQCLSFHRLWDLGCNVICWCWSMCFWKPTVTAPVYQEILEHFMLPSADQLFKDADFIFQRTWHLPTLPKAPKVGEMTMVLVCLTGQQTHQTWIP